MPEFTFIAVTPTYLSMPSIAIAASRAEGIGMLDLEYYQDEHTVLAALATLERYTKGRFGIKLAGSNEELLSKLRSNWPSNLEIVILTHTHNDILRRQVKTLHKEKKQVLLQVTTIEQAHVGIDVKADGLIAKGNEAGGWVGQETTFILLQRLASQVSLPVFAQGGIGIHTVAACYAAGAAGVVLDSQLLMTHESQLPEEVKQSIAHMDGSETMCLGEEIGMPFRVYFKPHMQVIGEIQEFERTLLKKFRQKDRIYDIWRTEIQNRISWGSSKQHLWPLGQDASFAVHLTRRFQTVGGILTGMRTALEEHIRAGRATKPLDKDAPLARSHGTRYPIVQGPMTRVSDRASFATKVAKAGALPFLALGLMSGSEVKILLEEVSGLIGSLPWGVGILGFVPLDLRQEQLEVIRVYRPPFAIIAGGRPDQAQDFENEGIATYLHVPSPELLKIFLRNGARRFIFEGHECGGHVGPRSSFVLWDILCSILLDSLPRDKAQDYHVLFAGGIHDARSSAMVAVMSAPLALRGIKVGVLLGTSYLFTDEAVASGAIVEGFQQVAVQCQNTILLESGVGHIVRCANTPYADKFRHEKQRLSRTERSAEEIRSALEDLNLGRLRVAAKGIARNPNFRSGSKESRFISVDKKEQNEQGMYMIGQLAALRDQTLTMEELHHDIAIQGSQILNDQADPYLSRSMAEERTQPCDIAIIGMACLMPKARSLNNYWQNILNKVDAITEIPKERWDWQLYYDLDRQTRDKVYSKWGGFLDEIPFDPMHYGMPPSSLPSIEPLQLLTLETVRAAMKDAGYAEREFHKERTAVILGAGGGIGDLGQYYAFRSNLPTFFQDVSQDLFSQLPEWTEDSFAGILPNVTAGRVANRFDLGGINFTVDAACGSSLAAVYAAVRELENKTSDMVIVGGADTLQNPFTYFCFSKTQALSPTGKCRTFDESADGTCISEGIAILILKRLTDAERDGDRIYAIIKGVGGSSDGRAKGLTAPHPEGQARALNRAYTKAGISPATVGLIEAHGTGTVVGDQAEIETLRGVFEKNGASHQACALGSVKSMIGHTKCTAGAASLIKVALSLYHNVLPPTIGVEKPNRSLVGSPFYVNTEPRPWIHSSNNRPHRAGISAFGFGGTNFHAVVEEYADKFLNSACEAVSQDWSSELFLWAGRSREEILRAIDSLGQALAQGAKPTFRDLAYTLWKEAKDQSVLKLAIVANSMDDLQQKLLWAKESLEKPGNIHDPRGIYFIQEPLAREGKVAFLFPGQGSQYPDMLSSLAIHFPEVRKRFELADRVLADMFLKPLSTYIFPPPRFSQEEEKACQEALTETNVVQPALGAAGMGIYFLLRELGICPSMVAGHSYGEYVALCAAGVFSEETLYTLSEARGRFILESEGENLGRMAAVEAGRKTVVEALDSVKNVWVANMNAPKQTVIAGKKSAIEKAKKRLELKGILVRDIAVSCAYHSPLVRAAKNRLADFISTLEFTEPAIEVFSNTLATSYPQDPEAIASLLGKHLIEPVEFVKEIEAMYQAGARIFVEVGPRAVLTNLTQQILKGHPHVTVSLDIPSRSGLIQLQHVLGQLVAHGVQIQLDRLYKGRSTHQLNLKALVEETREHPPTSTTWMVDGGHTRPLKETNRIKTATSLPKKGGVDHIAEGQDFEDIQQMQREITKASEEKRDFSSLSSMPELRFPETSSSNTLDSAVNRIMLKFQNLMEQFLETQKQVMLAYLRGSTAEATMKSLVSASEKTSEMAKAVMKDLTRNTTPLDTQTDSTLQPLIEGSAKEQDLYSDRISAQKATPSSNREQLTRHLIQLVSDRTGYPQEMIDLDLNIEADLGIDSIKWVEILGALQETYLSLSEGQLQATMEKLVKVKTLRGIVDWINNAVQSQPEETAEQTSLLQSEETFSQPSVEGHKDKTVAFPSRFLLKAVDVPLNAQSLKIPSDSSFLITDDKRGIAQGVAKEMKRLGGRVVRIQMGEKVRKKGRDLYTADLTNPVAVAEVVKLIRQKRGPIGGVIHLLPLGTVIPFEEMSLRDWRRSIQMEVKSLFYLAKAVKEDLIHGPDNRGGWFVAATGMGGSFASDIQFPTSFFPAQGGIAGLVKALTLEWPTVLCKVVDVDTNASDSSLISCLINEITHRDKEIEVGYVDSRRLVLRPWRTPLEMDGAEISLDSSWVILAIGGGRGITAEVTIELAERYQPTILVVGRSFLAKEESPEIAELTSPKQLKEALIEQMRKSGQHITVGHVEATYKELCRDREIRRNLAAMQQCGAKVRYYQVDVRDEQAFGNLITDIYRTYGRLDGVIHGAGIIEDKLLDEKSFDSFDRVFDTKADSAFILGSKLRADSLKFIVFFSSVVGRFGNRGQTDYAAANEALNKQAVYLDRHLSGRVVAVNWGPWAKAGMASPEVQRQLEERGLQLIQPSAGRRILDEEIRYGRKGQVEVVIGEGPWNTVESTRPSDIDDGPPLLNGLSLKWRDNGSVELVRVLNPKHDRYLMDHQIDDKPVFPLAMAMELFAEVVQKGWSEFEIVGISSLRVLKGIVLDKTSREILVVAKPTVISSAEDSVREVEVEIMDSNQTGHSFYRAVVQIAKRLPAPPPFDRSILSELRAFPMTVREAYQRWLFHGPCFHGISKIEGFNEKGICGVIAPSSPDHWLFEKTSGHWLIDPGLLDSGFQMLILWERVNYDMTPLPSGFKSYRRFSPPSRIPVQCFVKANASVGGHMLTADFYFIDTEGRLMSLLEKAECACSKSLNRLAK